MIVNLSKFLPLVEEEIRKLKGGEKVICIRPHPTGDLILGKVYTIVPPRYFSSDMVFIAPDENGKCGGDWYAERFSLLKKSKRRVG